MTVFSPTLSRLFLWKRLTLSSFARVIGLRLERARRTTDFCRRRREPEGARGRGRSERVEFAVIKNVVLRKIYIYYIHGLPPSSSSPLSAFPEHDSVYIYINTHTLLFTPSPSSFFHFYTYLYNKYCTKGVRWRVLPLPSAKTQHSLPFADISSHRWILNEKVPLNKTCGSATLLIPIAGAVNALDVASTHPRITTKCI